MADDLSRSKTVIIIGVVLACFAVLWPYVFYPMLTASLQQTHSYKSESKTSHQAAYMRQERSSSIRPETIHPALMEKGRAIPHRTIDMQAKPGPMPGVRPTIGAGAHIPTTNKKGGGTMGIVMPIYTIGIVIFFLYSLMKVLSKPPEKDDANTSPKVKDFHMDPEYRKYVFAEEYLDKSNTSYRDTLKRKERSSKRTRLDATPAREMKIEDEQMDELQRRLDDTEKAMEKLMFQMGSVSDKLTAAKITEVFSQAQTQSQILKGESEIQDSEDEVTISELITHTLSEEFSLPENVKRLLENLQVKEELLKGITTENYESKRDVLQLKKIINSTVNSKAYPIVSSTCIQTINDEKSCFQNKTEEKSAVKVNGSCFSDNIQVNLRNGINKCDCMQSDNAVIEDDELTKSSESSQTGADVSEMTSYTNEIEQEIQEDTIIPVENPRIPEATYCPKFQNFLTTPNDRLLDESPDEKFKNISEIVLDAAIPLDSQLYISRTGSSMSDCVDIENSDSESSPCIITSQLSLSFVGMETTNELKFNKNKYIETNNKYSQPENNVLEKRCEGHQMKNPDDLTVPLATHYHHINKSIKNPKIFHQSTYIHNEKLTSKVLREIVDEEKSDGNIMTRPLSPVPPKADKPETDDVVKTNRNLDRRKSYLDVMVDNLVETVTKNAIQNIFNTKHHKCNNDILNESKIPNDEKSTVYMMKLSDCTSTLPENSSNKCKKNLTLQNTPVRLSTKNGLT